MSEYLRQIRYPFRSGELGLTETSNEFPQHIFSSRNKKKKNVNFRASKSWLDKRILTILFVHRQVIKFDIYTTLPKRFSIDAMIPFYKMQTCFFGVFFNL